MTDNWDAIVVGGGPAGSAMAARLARLSHRVLLLDRAEFPRDKPCGECLSPGAVRQLAELGVLDKVRAAGAVSLSGWKIVPARAHSFIGEFTAGEEGFALPRSTLDSILLESARTAGVEVRTGERVTDLVRAGRAVTGVRTGRAGRSIRARLVVGADGIRSVVVRRLGLLRRSPRLRKLALTGHVRGVEGLGGRGELHVRAWGCVGVAAVGGDLANVTVVVNGGEAGRVGGDREQFFDTVLASEPRFADCARDGGVLATGPFDWPTRSAVADGAMLVGDAAGYYDPFTGQGMYRAMKGAAMAAEVADNALRTNDPSARALRKYDRDRRREFGPGIRVQHLVEAFVARPAMMKIAAHQLGGHTAAANALVAVVGDVAPVRSLLRPGLLFSGA
ncbi:MAG TPA: NAD(P)/FAD-dependent oxidoreductase [Longimicrobiaceae bacterium]|nr:NAD(P)/FAD-dependent oxidoreductase [Longimicrobiaceae bacterium]